ncbi:ATPase family associated with various cellular activities (AAA) [Tenacibaculum sp. MAR_2009_124]|uniref:AAA family ATPase n=1 Tax=Tenacibaculum sp. MAR_2009_124 TaxID=1250059 RepID=UPI0008986CA0|nr:ATP-binding protein [Tenacibaculum sp. MAR_2009_124]SEC27571.1 ATPase family associated with various cellular activities (AAA) [Tenacibaculum sp. MAR_2009_124]
MSYDIITNPDAVKISLSQLHLSTNNQEKLEQLIDEFSYLSLLRKYDLSVTNKVLFHGASGCGKTATAKAIAKRLHKKIITLDLSEFISSKLGETSKNISLSFKKAARENAVLFIDEFDSLGKLRDYDTKDSGEMKRVVNTLLQLIDHIPSNILLICATNFMKVIDQALLRRFEIKLSFELPTSHELDIYYDELLSRFPKNLQDIERTYHISYAEAKDIAENQVKKEIIFKEKSKEKIHENKLAYN